MKLRPIRTRIFKEGEKLVPFITHAVPRIREGTVLVVTSKIVALAENRTAATGDKARVIARESAWVKKVKYGALTLKDGLLMWNAGIDASNANGKIILLPKDSFRAARDLRTLLKRHYKVRRLGVLITDSRIMPLRAGVVAVSLGYAGFKGLRDYRGRPDIFGRPLKHTQTDIADSLATAAALVMGEGKERQPLCVIEDAPVSFAASVNERELRIAPELDMYRPVLRTPRAKKRGR